MTLIENVGELLTNSANLIPPLNNPFDLDTDCPINLGIDKVRIGFNLIPPYFRDEDALQWAPGGRRASWPLTEHVDLSLYTNKVKGVQRGYITFNPARVIDPHGTTCASWDETLVMIGKCAEIAYKQFFVFKPSLADLDLYGLHLTADFAPIADMQRTLDKAKRLRVFRGSKPHGYFSADGANLESVYFNSASRGQVKFYDKSVQANLEIPTLRVEFETNRALHRTDGITKVRDVNSSVLERLFRSHVEPLIRSLNPLHRRHVDDILKEPLDTKTLIQICGREFLQRLGIYPNAGMSYKARASKFQAKYPYLKIEDIL